MRVLATETDPANEQPAPVRKQFSPRDIVALGANVGLPRHRGDYDEPGSEEMESLQVPSRISPQDLNVSVEDGAIVLRGEKKQDVRGEENGCYRLERAHGTFVRMIPMPDYADPDHALAKFENGVLTLTVPKLKPTRAASRTIDIG